MAVLNLDAMTVDEARSARGWSVVDLIRPRRAVLDTGPLLSDVMKSVARSTPSPLCFAIQTGLVAAFAARHVWAEVPRNLEKRASELGLSYGRLEWVWWNWYVPYISFVDCIDLQSTRDSSILAARDPSDADTLKLHGLLEGGSFLWGYSSHALLECDCGLGVGTFAYGLVVPDYLDCAGPMGWC